MENETVVVEQGQGIGGQLIELRILEAQRRLDLTPSLLLAKQVGDVVGAERTGGMRFAERQIPHPAHIPEPEPGARGLAEPENGRCRLSALGRIRTLDPEGRLSAVVPPSAAPPRVARAVLFEALTTDHLPALPAASVRNDLLVINGDRG